MNKLNELLDERMAIESMPESDVCTLYKVDRRLEALILLDEEIKSLDVEECDEEEIEYRDYEGNYYTVRA